MKASIFFVLLIAACAVAASDYYGIKCPNSLCKGYNKGIMAYVDPYTYKQNIHYFVQCVYGVAHCQPCAPGTVFDKKWNKCVSDYKYSQKCYGKDCGHNKHGSVYGQKYQRSTYKPKCYGKDCNYNKHGSGYGQKYQTSTYKPKCYGKNCGYNKHGNQYGNQYGNKHGNRYGNKYGNNHGNQYGTKYGSQYGNKYGNKYGNNHGNQYGNNHNNQYGNKYDHKH